MYRNLILLVLMVSTSALADTIILKNGESFQGKFFGGTSEEIRFVVDGKLMFLKPLDVKTIHFGEAPVEPAGAPQPSPTPETEEPVETEATSDKEELVDVDSDKQSVTILQGDGDPEPAYSQIEEQETWIVKAGTDLEVRLLEDVDARSHRVGDTFRAVLDKAVLVDGRPALPQGTEAHVRIVSKSGDSSQTSRKSVTLSLARVRLGNGWANVTTSEKVFNAGGSKTEKVLGGLSRAGAKLGEILVSQSGQPMPRSDDDRNETSVEDMLLIASGTVLEFTLRNPLEGGSEVDVE